MKAPHVVFAAVWTLSIAILLSAGRIEQASFALGFLIVALALLAVVIHRTDEQPPPIESASHRHGVPLLGWLLALYGLLCLQTFNDFGLSVVPPLQDALRVSTAPLEDVARYVGVPAAVPLALVVLGAAIGGCRVAGASWAGLGFGRGRQATIVIAVIGTPLLLLIVVFVAIGIVTPANLAPVAVVSAVVAAVEEIYFRGCLQSRFERTWGTAWGLVITALVFALFHTAMLTGATHASLPVAAAAGVAQQGVLGGLVLGVAFQRTRTLAVPIIVHALGNTALIPLFT